MTMDVGLARLIGFCVDIVLSVVYTGLFVGAMLSLKKRWGSANISAVVPGVLIFMFLLNVAQLCLQGADIYKAFFLYKDIPGQPAAYFSDFSSRILPSRDAIFWIMSILTDALVIWRLYVIWRNNIYIIIPSCAILAGGIATGVIMYVYSIRRMLEDSPALSITIDKWWEITMGFTIFLNVLTPGLIIGRLWYIARQIGVIGSSSSRVYKQIALGLMESGILYTMTITGWLILFASGSLPALWMSSCILPTIVAIVPTLIILRINNFSSNSNPSQRPSGSKTNMTWGAVSGDGVKVSVSHWRVSEGDRRVDIPMSPKVGTHFTGSEDSMVLGHDLEKRPSFPTHDVRFESDDDNCRI